ncbi:MAG: hypothetical protein J6O62_02080 [Bacilli bacterium]|nr:hypothetical protein [Bacilli bacterium]MBO6194854.1 hypothetical protein [Bacilli bacterium]
MSYNLDEIVEKAKNGELSNIAKSGSAVCYDVNDDYVLVAHKIASSSKKFAELSEKLADDTKCIYTVLGYKEENNLVYELQKKATGEHFRVDSTKQDVYDRLASQKRQMENMIEKSRQGDFFLTEEAITDSMEPLINKLENKINSPEFQELIDTRKDELQRRYEKILNMPKEHISDFFESVLILHDNKIEYDSSGNNVLYDPEKGFAIIDLTDCSKRENLKGDINTMLDSNNYQTMQVLLGVDRLNEVKDEDKKEVIESMKEALKKICASVIDMQHNGQKMTGEIMNKSLETYKKYGIDLSYNEIQELDKEQVMS